MTNNGIGLSQSLSHTHTHTIIHTLSLLTRLHSWFTYLQVRGEASNNKHRWQDWFIFASCFSLIFPHISCEDRKSYLQEMEIGLPVFVEQPCSWEGGDGSDGGWNDKMIRRLPSKSQRPWIFRRPVTWGVWRPSACVGFLWEAVLCHDSSPMKTI